MAYAELLLHFPYPRRHRPTITTNVTQSQVNHSGGTSKDKQWILRRVSARRLRDE